MRPHWKERLVNTISSRVLFDCSLKKYTSFDIGGPAASLVILDKREELQTLLEFLKMEKIRWRVIGRGTNILVRDEGYPGVIIVLGKGFKKIARNDILEGGKTLLTVGAGHGLSALSSICSDSGLSGLEFSCGIPGTVGGAVIMNAGAWGGDMAQVVDTVTVETSDGIYKLTRDELDFSYRSWPGFRLYQGMGIVTETSLRLVEAEPENIKKQCRKLLEKRKESQPSLFPNAGSVFKNPAQESAGRLIEISGLKGAAVGGAMVSEKHGNFIVNTGDATASDVFVLIRIIQEKVKEYHNIDLEPEVHFI